MLELIQKWDKDLKCFKLYVIDEYNNIIYKPTSKDMYFSKDLLKHSLGMN